MKRIGLIMFVILSLFQDCGNLPKLYEYEDVLDFHIPYSAILIQPQETYDVYIYSPSCSHCNELKSLIINRALSSDDTIYFVKVSSEISFGHQIECDYPLCHHNGILIPGYPVILYVRSQCVIKQIVGVSNIKEYYSDLS